MEVFAKGKFIKGSSRKARLIVDLVRGKKVAEAIKLLSFSQKGAARPVLKVLNSAVANAKNNFNLDEERLYISRATVDSGPTLKRGRFTSRGRWHPILKRTLHVTIGLREVAGVGEVREVKKRRKSSRTSKTSKTPEP